MIWLPYVYKMTHKETGQFYFGSRSANILPPEQDLFFKYKTSSKVVSSNIHLFIPEILAQFIDQESAFLFENHLIESEWGNPLLINKHFQKSFSSFSMTGFKRFDVIEWNKLTKSKPKEFREYECTNCRDTFYLEEFCHHHRRISPFCSKTCITSYHNKQREYSHDPRPYQIGRIPWNKGLTKDIDERIACYGKSVSKSTKGRVAWNKGKPNPVAADNARKGAQKLSIRVTGRRLITSSDGKRTWHYPNNC